MNMPHTMQKPQPDCAMGRLRYEHDCNQSTESSLELVPQFSPQYGDNLGVILSHIFNLRGRTVEREERMMLM